MALVCSVIVSRDTYCDCSSSADTTNAERSEADNSAFTVLVESICDQQTHEDYHDRKNRRYCRVSGTWNVLAMASDVMEH